MDENSVGRMKKHMLLASILIASFVPQASHASSLTCTDVAGTSIFGYDYDEYIFIGAISNEYGSESIANDYGWGNEYRSDSINNEYGTFGGEYGSYSAYNEYTSTPPIIVNSDLEFVGYLTANEFLEPSIHPDIAKWCAKNTFASAPYGHEDMTFRKIPKSATSSGGGYVCPKNSYPNPANPAKCLCNQGYEINTSQTACVPAKSCPANSTGTWGSCTCNTGYIWKNDKCMTYTESCQQRFGYNSYGDAEYCYCSAGYQMNSTKSSCIPKPNKTTTTTSKTSKPKSKASGFSSSVTPNTKREIACSKRGKVQTCACPTGYKPNKDGKKCVWAKR